MDGVCEMSSQSEPVDNERPWVVTTPTLFRYLPSKHVDEFFNDGSLRLSSFSMFKQHEDEQRLDKKEGETLFVHRTQEGGGQTIAAKAYHGLNAYALSASIQCDKTLMTTFGCDSYIRINDPTGFGHCVSNHLPDYIGGAEGLCLYQDNKIIERDLGYVDPLPYLYPNNTRKRREKLISKFVNDQMGHFPFFLKDRFFSHQFEYRLVWVTSGQVSGYLDLKVPEAIRYCSRPNAITE
jgi:hypothetical protein